MHDREQEVLAEKLQRKQERLAQEKERKDLEAKDSYLKVEQFDYIYERTNNVKRRLKSQQDVIDLMEKKLL